MTSLKDRRILVTGGAGFLGRKVCEKIELREPTEIFVPRRAEFDLCRPDVVRSMLETIKPDIVIHLAAEVGGIGANRKNPGRFFYANATMGIHLLEECRLIGVEKYLQVGTVCSYPKFAAVPFREDEIWNGYPEETNAPYGLAKKMLLVQAQAYRQQYDLNAVTIIPVNLYGPGDNFDLESSHVIPALIRKVLEAKDASQPSIEVWGTGSASREFLHVDDAADAIVTAVEKYDDAEPVNIGCGKEVKIRELVEIICELCGFEGELVWDSTKPDGQPRRCLDTSRATQRFGFTAETSLRDGLKATIEWYHSQRQQGSREAA